MSKDKIRPLLKAVADLPEVHTGFVLDIVNQLRSENSAKVRMALGLALTSLRMGLNSEEVGNLFNPSEYFIALGFLWVSPQFNSRILLEHNDPMEKRGLEGVTHFDLPGAMYDTEIIEEHLGGEEEVRKHAFTPDQVAELIDKQKDGGEGELLNNGHANIFYVIGKNRALFAVYVLWGRDSRRWAVDAYKLDELGAWCAGHRFFRNTS